MIDYAHPDAAPAPSMMCQTCKHILTRTVSFEDLVVGGAVVDRIQVPAWYHPYGIDFDHEPVPVPAPADLADAAMLCDFCSAHYVAGYAHSTPFKITYRGIEHRDDGVWACCTTCRALLEAHKGNRLLARVTKILTDKHGPEHAEAVSVLLTGFLKHFTGEIADRHTQS